MIATADDDEAGAAHWAVRIAELGTLDPGEHAMLDAWLAERPARAGALLRAEATLAYLDRGRVLDLPQPDTAAPSRRRVIGWAVAGGGGAVAAALGLTILRMPPTQRFDTGIGETRRVPLADGSVASLNTGSQVIVTMDGNRRQVRLRSGEAWFQVAHDAARPFVVEAGEARVRAVGTAFSVRRLGAGTAVLVTQGLVEAWVEESSAGVTRIPAGSRVFLPDDPSLAKEAPAAVPAPEAIERALAWRQGELALDGETLAYAVAELNRYNRVQLHVDGRLGAETLVGYFRTNDPEGFARTVATMIGARVVRRGEVLDITPDAAG